MTFIPHVLTIIRPFVLFSNVICGSLIYMVGWISAKYIKTKAMATMLLLLGLLISLLVSIGFSFFSLHFTIIIYIIHICFMFYAISFVSFLNKYYSCFLTCSKISAPKWLHRFLSICSIRKFFLLMADHPNKETWYSNTNRLINYLFSVFYSQLITLKILNMCF